MRAYFLKSPEMQLELRDAPQPQAKPGQHLVRVRAAGLNRGEFLRHGLTKPGPAKIGGTEGGGVAAGAGAEHQQLGLTIVRHVGLQRTRGLRSRRARG